MNINKVIRKMGDKYICHPSRRVQRLETPLADSAGVNVAETFRRVMAEKQQPSNVRRIVVAK